MTRPESIERSYSANWSRERWDDAVGEAMQQSTLAAQAVIEAKAEYLRACREWSDAEEWTATLGAARARFATRSGQEEQES
jgi:hypothetical protein